MPDANRVYRLAPIAAAIILGLVAAVGLLGRGSGLFARSPDYRALCELECACTGCNVDDCEAKMRELAEEQGECRAAGDAVVECKLEPGGAECQSSGGWTLLMPTERCKPAIERLAGCLSGRHGG